MLAASAARRWLARNAADIHSIANDWSQVPLALTSLVSCLPALQRVKLCLPEFLSSDELRCLLEALSWCPNLNALKLFMISKGNEEEDQEEETPFPVSGCAPAFAKLRSLTELMFSFKGLSYSASPSPCPTLWAPWCR